MHTTLSTAAAAHDASDNSVPPAAAQNVELWPVERRVPYANNPRRHDAAVDQMIVSIQPRSKSGGSCVRARRGSRCPAPGWRSSCRAMELDPQYADVIVERWQRFTSTSGRTGQRWPAR